MNLNQVTADHSNSAWICSNITFKNIVLFIYYPTPHCLTEMQKKGNVAAQTDGLIWQSAGRQVMFIDRWVYQMMDGAVAVTYHEIREIGFITNNEIQSR